MNRLSLSASLIVSVVILFNVAWASAAAPDDSQSQIGRYQPVAGSDGALYVLDTATGQCWRRVRDGAWIDAGNPTEAQTIQPEPVLPPLSLELDDEPVVLTIQQHRTKLIPGSQQRILLDVSDITGGQVLLAVRSDSGEVLLDETSVKQGDVVRFQVAQERFYIRVRELSNFLTGSDFGVFEISSRRPEPSEPAESNEEDAPQESLPEPR